MSDLPLTEGCWARVTLRPDCDGDGKPHHPAEHGARVLVSIGRDSAGHRIWGNYKGLPWSVVFPPSGGLGIGRHFAADDLEVLPPGRIDPTPEDDAERREMLERQGMLFRVPLPRVASLWWIWGTQDTPTRSGISASKATSSNCWRPESCSRERSTNSVSGLRSRLRSCVSAFARSLKPAGWPSRHSQICAWWRGSSVGRWATAT